MHQHCIKCAGSAFANYSIDHGGRYPSHTNGFGDALALLAATDDLAWARFLVGVDDDGGYFISSATNHTHYPDEACTRIYVQGLGETNNPQIAILFDRYAVKGGDHRRGHGPYLREVLFVGGGVEEVQLRNWPTFASNQVKLLVNEGIPLPIAEAYYAPTMRPDATR